ncbi:peptide MFS transporter [Campylobacter sp. faydin G-105]|uniref:peptide MFS transporter n=1 Tax=Campylobacter anatolicus TaxID=2829105 RepID=UPI001B9984EB|nr:peptide MFS transporter [Campylobacter anatolicus]MBR8461798.1 peptide MFS transporter [Campylobacter anatolicus]
MKKVWVLFSTEMWEKFNFYGLRAIFSLFMVHFLGLSETDAAIYYGAFLALSYLTPIVGGALADRILSYNASIIIGAILLSMAQLVFFVAACGERFERTLSLIAAVFMICGNGFFKPSIMALLSSSIDESSKFDAVFSTYYFFLNLGVLLGVFIVPFFADVVVDGVRDISAFKWGFLAAFFAMLIGLIIYLKFSERHLKVVREKNMSLTIDSRNLVICMGIFAVVFITLVYFASGNLIKTYLYPLIYAIGISLATYVLLDKNLSRAERGDVVTIFISAFFIIFFWATFEQAGSSLTFIANNQTDRNLLGFNVPAAMVQMFNPLFVLILSLPFAAFWSYLDRQKKSVSNLDKQAFGLVLMGLSYAIIAYGVSGLGTNLLSIKWLILLYFMQTCAEMLVSPIGFSLVGKLSPRRFLGLIFGIFYLANAAGYALSGTLAALMPPTADKFIKANELGINLNDILNGAITPNAEQIVLLNTYNLPLNYPQIFGYQIVSLYDFFMIFCVICLLGGVMLFGIARIKTA